MILKEGGLWKSSPGLGMSFVDRVMDINGSQVLAAFCLQKQISDTIIFFLSFSIKNYVKKIKFTRMVSFVISNSLCDVKVA